mmetsp:Transcript_26319/g.65927  ORF Transcript_26319/g.65927 Transcript_26319/m.65927 type:complete len:206 (-) Transcript_26319:725-1342(-)
MSPGARVARVAIGGRGQPVRCLLWSPPGVPRRHGTGRRGRQGKCGSGGEARGGSISGGGAGECGTESGLTRSVGARRGGAPRWTDRGSWRHHRGAVRRRVRARWGSGWSGAAHPSPPPLPQACGDVLGQGCWCPALPTQGLDGGSCERCRRSGCARCWSAPATTWGVPSFARAEVGSGGRGAAPADAQPPRGSCSLGGAWGSTPL